MEHKTVANDSVMTVRIPRHILYAIRKEAGKRHLDMADVTREILWAWWEKSKENGRDEVSR